MFEKLKQKKEEKKRIELERACEKAKENAFRIYDEICLKIISEDAIKVFRASQCCVNDEDGECKCENCPLCDDEDCLSTLTDTAHRIAIFVGKHELAKANATVTSLKDFGIEVAIDAES